MTRKKIKTNIGFEGAGTENVRKSELWRVSGREFSESRGMSVKSKEGSTTACS